MAKRLVLAHLKLLSPTLMPKTQASVYTFSYTTLFTFTFPVVGEFGWQSRGSLVCYHFFYSPRLYVGFSSDNVRRN